MKKYLVIAGCLALAIVVAGILLRKGSSGNSAREASQGREKAAAAGKQRTGAASVAVEPEAAGFLEKIPDRTMSKSEILTLLDQVADVLRSGDPDASKQALTRLDEVFTGKHHDAAAGISAIVEFLKSGKDAGTGEGFVVGEGGVLAESSTLRVFLMDQLGSLSREAGSSAALEVARGNLRHPDSADEWAVSMRNVAWFDSNSREFLMDRVSAMLGHEPWRKKPSQGMQEAFDLIVYTGALNTVPELERIMTGSESPLGRAAAVAMDRLAAARPLELTTLLNQKPELFASTPLLRADLFAHADLANPAQRQQTEAYLLRADVQAAEREKFFSSLLQSGQFVSHNLTTEFVPPETPAQAGLRLDVLSRTLNAWLADERFSGLRGELSRIGEVVNRIGDEIDADTSE